MRVLALDPGERIGWASAEVLPERQIGSMTYDAELRVTDHGIEYLKDMAMAVYRAVEMRRDYDFVVMEDWRLTPRGAKVSIGSDMPSSQFIGAVRLCCWVSGTKLVVQPPAALSSARRSLRCDHPSAADVLARIEALPKSHDESHDESALLHLWHWFFGRYV